MKKFHSNTLKTWFPAFAGMTIALLFSFWLMVHTFSYDTANHSVQISSKLWSDFGAHVPMVRSFSKGENLSRLLRHEAIESPLFPGEPIRYHFGFYALVGVLEKLGIRLDWAMNFPSALGFFLLLYTIYKLSHTLFSDHRIAALSVVFFLFNGSLSFLSFFATHPLSAHTITDIITNARFPSFGPWDGGIISAFWNLNIYTNQRHLALSYGLVLTSILLVKFPSIYLQKRPLYRAMAIAIALSTLLLVNFPVAAIAGVFLVWIFLSDKATRSTLCISAILTVPAALWLHGFANPSQHIMLQPGYLVHTPLTPMSIWNYWWHNLGLHTILIPLGLLLAPRLVHKLFLLPLVIVFIVPNVFQFSPDMINNHKFFNFFLILGNMFSAHAMIRIIQRVTRAGEPHSRGPLVGGLWGWRAAGPVVSIIMILLLTLSGIIDFFPIVNDYKGTITDTASNPDVRFFANTPNDAIVANSTWFYHPASLAGRAIFSGYTYFTWSYGYDQTGREASLVALYSSPDKDTMCYIAQHHNISYIELSRNPEKYLTPNMRFWNSLTPTYENPDTGLRVYSKNTLCNENR